jgi:hypothetical protein
MLRSLKVIFSNQKVKEKDREYSSSYRERSGGARQVNEWAREKQKLLSALAGAASG